MSEKVDIDHLKLYQIEKVARNEIERSAEDCPGVPRDVVIACAKWYTAMYLGSQDIWARICEKALAPIGSPAWRVEEEGPEWVCGRILACAAIQHVKADFDLAQDEFMERALDCDIEQGPVPFLDGKEVDEARREGVDMGKEFRSAQTLSPNDVAELAADIEVCGEPASKVLSPTDYEQMAAGLMGEFRELGLEYSDRQELSLEIAERAEGKYSQGGREDEEEPVAGGIAAAGHERGNVQRHGSSR